MPRTATNYQPNPELTQVTATPNIQTEQATNDPRGNSGFQLAEALGVAAPAMDKFNAEWQQRKEQEQIQKKDWYIEQINRDVKSGAVNKAQLKEMFPEMVPAVAMRIAGEVGKQRGVAGMAEAIAEVNTNDALRLDTVARKAFLTAKRQELLGKVDPGNEFFASGYVQGMDSQVSQYESTWASETAGYHQKVQTDGFSKEVLTAINSGGDLLALDKNWKVSSLNDIERKKVVVATAVDAALAGDDPTVLDKIPHIFHNADSKALFARTRLQIQEHRMSSFRYDQQMKEYQRTEELRSGKLEIVQALASGQPLDPRKYAQKPELFQFAVAIRDTPMVDESVSKASTSAIEQSILSSATVGGTGDPNKLIETIARHDRLNPKDKQALIEKLPKLMEGRQLMKDDVVRQQFSDRLNPLFDMLEKSPTTMLAHLGGKSPRTDVMRGFDNEIQRSFTAFYETNGKWPTGFEKKELVDKAVEKSEAHLEKLSKFGGSPSQSSAAKPSNKPAALPKGVTKIE